MPRMRRSSATQFLLLPSRLKNTATICGKFLRSSSARMFNEIINGDAAAELARLPAGCAQAIIADPPYYNVLSEDWDMQWVGAQEYLDWCLAWASECIRVLRDDGLFF